MTGLFLWNFIQWTSIKTRRFSFESKIENILWIFCIFCYLFGFIKSEIKKDVESRNHQRVINITPSQNTKLISFSISQETSDELMRKLEHLQVSWVIDKPTSANWLFLQASRQQQSPLVLYLIIFPIHTLFTFNLITCKAFFAHSRTIFLSFLSSRDFSIKLC